MPTVLAQCAMIAPELKQLNLDHLIGGGSHVINTTDGSKKATFGGSLVRPYMYGYFVDQRLYEARLIVDPFEWERERKRMVAAKIEKQRESRIRSTRSTAATAKVKINK
ncbi:hypothetical protein B9Z19DRAFT_1137616 [Tuber borchii]|uniref:Nucleolar protein 10-like second domain-containing protein n=1 Tax=Tuber borchii TaxID=42251 RepID=A0A2T6ZAA3_TUBBO|nr:hypothetical protein B9Z19DRAFT_1137616 [Tuber borchii]